MGTLLDGSERRLFDGVASEVMRLAGTNDPVLWKLMTKTIESVSGLTDCLYEEPIHGAQLYRPYRCVGAFFTSKEQSSEATDDGLQQRVDGVIYFTRVEMEHAKVPLSLDKNHVTEGDIIQLWAKNKLRTWFFRVLNVNRDGWQNDSDVFTHYECDVVRHSSFSPEQAIFK